jgi:hypothetical protein
LDGRPRPGGDWCPPRPGTRPGGLRMGCVRTA